MSFKQNILACVGKIPKGKVVSYGQVAAASDKPHGAREVGRILRNLDISEDGVPWWRVVNNRGVISIKGNWTASKDLQAKLLQKEGVKVSKDFSLDIEKYRFKL